MAGDRMTTDARTLLITGASSGIGEACAHAFAAAGARLVLVARREERLDALARRLADAHESETLTVALDVRDRPAVEATLGALPAEWRDVDVLINSAGLAAGLAAFQDADPDDWDRMLETNVRGVLSVTRALLPGMLARRTGHVINIGSIAGRGAYPGGSVYCASKAALDRITAGLRMDVLGSGVRVSTVDPGMVETEFSVVRFHGDRARADSVYAGLTPLSAADVAEAVLWVADRPPHVVVADMMLLPLAQAGSGGTLVHREA
jgi:3-hydroxy acid dehydrogenase/malonic semialdehyde reductase